MRKILNDRMALFSGIYLENLSNFKKALKCLVGDEKFNLVWYNRDSCLYSCGRFTMTIDQDNAGTILLTVYAGKPVEKEEDSDFVPMPWKDDHLAVLTTDQTGYSVVKMVQELVQFLNN